MSAIRKCLFPAAGYGTRFLPATKAMPKEMLPIVNKPLIQYGVEEAVRAGISEMAFVTGRGKRALEDHFDISYELEREIAGSEREALLAETRDLVRRCNFSYTRQLEARGLGHAVLTGETLIGEQAFAVLLADDFCVTEDAGVLAQLTRLYQRHQCSIVAVEEVPEDETSRYGIISPEAVSDEDAPDDGAARRAAEIARPKEGPSGGPGSANPSSARRDSGLFQVADLVEKPSHGTAPSNLAAIGRYILTPDIFDLLRQTAPGHGGEIQLTDALAAQARAGKVLAWRFPDRRFDCGNIEGYLAANNHIWRTTQNPPRQPS